MKNNNNEIEKIIPSSPNFQTELAEKIAEIVPEVMSDGKIDVVKLRELINGDVENSPEKFGLFWPGKARAQAVAQIPTSATLIPAPEESVNWDNTKNIYIEGDNLEVLKALQNSYRRKVKMIYIDPPYNTGKEFIYPDNYQEGLQTYLEYTGQKNEAGESTESKKETGGRKHTNWLNMMYPRLQLAKSLLTDDGVIFISINDIEQANLKKLCDEVFGEENCLGQIIWRNKSGGGKQGIDLGAKEEAKKKEPFVTDHEYLIVFTKNVGSVNQFQLPLSKKEIAKYKNLDEDINGPYVLEDLERAIPGERENNHYPITDPDGEKIVPKGGRYKWRYIETSYLNELEKGHIFWKKVICPTSVDKRGYYFRPKTKQYLYINGIMRYKALRSVWHKLSYTKHGSQELRKLFELTKNAKDMFDNPKPVKLIKRIVYGVGLKKNDIALDFFSGSATTAHAVMQLNAEDGGNRTHIQVQLPEPTDEKSEAYKAGFKTISDIGKERIRRAGKKILTDNTEKLKERKEPLDVGFRVYKLAASNFLQWNEEKAKEDIQQSILDFADNKKPKTSPEAVLAEIMLQNKITLDAKIEKKKISNDGWVYVIDDGNLIAYVDEKQITEDQVKEIADMTPGKLIVVDSAFNGNDALKINVANICKEKFIKEFKTI